MDRPPGPKILVSVKKVAVSGGSNIVSFFEFIVGLIVDHQLSGFKYPLHPYHPGEAIWYQKQLKLTRVCHFIHLLLKNCLTTIALEIETH